MYYYCVITIIIISFMRIERESGKPLIDSKDCLINTSIMVKYLCDNVVYH